MDKPCLGVLVLIIRRRQLSRILLVLFVVSLASTQSALSLQSAADDVWIWSTRCSAKQQLSIAVRLDSKILYQALLPICHGPRDAENGRAEFHFPSSHLFDGQYTTKKSEMIEGDIWQAGGDTDALILGISFATKKQILLNTLHVAKADGKSSVALGNGLYITTYPVIAR